MEIFSRKIRAAFHLNDEEKFLSSRQTINATGVVQKSSRWSSGVRRWSKIETKPGKINRAEAAPPLSGFLRQCGDFDFPVRRDM